MRARAAALVQRCRGAAPEYCQLYVLTKADFDRIVDRFPAALLGILETVNQRVLAIHAGSDGTLPLIASSRRTVCTVTLLLLASPREW